MGQVAHSVRRLRGCETLLEALNPLLCRTGGLAGEMQGLSPAGWGGNENRSYVGSPWPYASCFSHKGSTVREIFELGYQGNSSSGVSCLQLS